MTQEIKMLDLLLKGQDDIKEQLKRVHSRLDKIAERSLVNEQSIKHLEKTFDDEKTETEKRFNIVHQSIRRRDGHLKWLYASIVIPVVFQLWRLLK